MANFNVDGEPADYGVFWPELAINQEGYGDIPNARKISSEESLGFEHPIQAEDHREEDWLRYFAKSAKTNTPTLERTNSVENQDDELYSCFEKVIQSNTDMKLKWLEVEGQKIEARKQQMQDSKKRAELRIEIKKIEKEQAKVQQQRGGPTTRTEQCFFWEGPFTETEKQGLDEFRTTQ